MRTKSIMLIVLLFVALVGLSSAVSARPRTVIGPGCPDPTPTPPTAVTISGFQVHEVYDYNLIMWSTALEYDYLGAEVVLTSDLNTPISPFVSATFPGQGLGDVYGWKHLNPPMGKVCYALHYATTTAWEYLVPNPPECVTRMYMYWLPLVRD